MEESDIAWDAMAEVGAAIHSAALGGEKGPGDGEHAVVPVVFTADIAGEGATEHYQYGFVFDSDADPANDYSSTFYPADFFAGTDRWYVLAHDPASGWALTAQDVVGGSPEEIPSAAQVMALENSLTLLVPTSELGDPAAVSYRVTAFRHDGTWLDGPWNGDVVPTVAEGLRPLLSE